jgi:hypothetical protein
MVHDPEGWKLPAVDHGDDWFAHEAVSVARKLGERLGIQLVALREIEEAGLRLCELENLSREWSPANGWQWFDRAAASAALCSAPSGLRDLVLAWFQQSGRRRPPATRPPWEKKGWYDGAVAWIEAQLGRLDRKPTGPIEQVKTAWSCSCILRVPTTIGCLYFKATYARPPAEVNVIQELARRWPDHLPTVVAADVSRRWSLMEDFGPRELSQMPFARWPGALRLFGHFQPECSANLPVWLGIGCPDRRMDQLANHLEPLLSGPLLARADPPFRLGEGELERFRADRERLADELLELGGSPLPNSIVQQDFRDGNVAVRGSDYLFYDWSDTVVSHPFFSACRFLEYVGSGGSANRRRRVGRRLPTAARHERLIDAYLVAWTEYASQDRLRAVFRQVQRLNPLYQAVRWHLELPYCEPGSPWWRVMLSSVTESLQELIHTMAAATRPQEPSRQSGTIVNGSSNANFT